MIGFNTSDCKKMGKKIGILYSRSSDYATRQVFTIVGIWHYGTTVLQSCALRHFGAFLLPAAVVAVAAVICLKSLFTSILIPKQ